jgi:hypothetical protein
MQVRIKQAEDDKGVDIPDNYIIDIIGIKKDAYGNDVDFIDESGQHTLKSISDNILAIESQQQALEEQKAKWIVFRDLIINFKQE